MFTLIAQFWPAILSVSGTLIAYLWGHKHASNKADEKVKQAEDKVVYTEREANARVLAAKTEVAAARLETKSLEDRGTIDANISNMPSDVAIKQLRDEWARKDN